jgi:SET domain-containing protein
MTEATTEPNEWRETVRDIYDLLDKQMFSNHNSRRNCQAAIKLIEERHPKYFACGEL